MYVYTVNVSLNFQHSVSIISGGWIVHKTIGKGAIYFIVFSLIAYIVLQICWTIKPLKRRCGFLVSSFCLCGLIIGYMLCVKQFYMIMNN